MNEQQQKIHDELLKRANAEGKLVEAGWLSMFLMVIPPDASPTQISEMRKAFFAGAQHLFASLMAIMDGDHEPTEADMRAMSLISTELEAWRMEVSSVHKPGAG